MKVSDNDFLLINLHNANKDSEQLNTLSTLCNLLDNITDLHCKIILGGDFNIFLNHMKSMVRIQKMKNKSLAKFIHFKESLGLCDIWRVRNPKKKHTFRQQHVTGFIQRRLYYFLVSNNLQESINKRNILTASSTDRLPIFISLSKNIDTSKGNGLKVCHKPDSVLN